MPVYTEQVNFPCPNCHISGNHIFKLEQRVTVRKRPENNLLETYGQTLNLLVCVSCGHSVDPSKPQGPKKV